MSRIHDALRKAEEERMRQPASAPPESEPLPHPAAAEDPWAVPAAPRAAAGPVAAPPPESDAARVLSARRVAWKPAPNDCLNFNSKQRAGTEEFRTLRSRLYQIRERQALKRLLVGSALPGEGKTFVALNLAQAFAQQHECRVLIIDCDLRRPRMHRALGAPLRPGMAEYLRGDADEFSILQQGPITNLFFIPAGVHIENPGDLLASESFKELVARLQPMFDWIVIDSPPALPVSDASVLSQDCDGVLMVVSSGRTLCDLGQRARREFQGCPVVGAVLNRVPHSSSYGRYYGYYGTPQAEGKNGR
jgi:protein-tyrosine kinase